jgi:riboflavin synthase
MFTGLVEQLGEVVDVADRPPGKRFTVRASEIAADVALGDSISINGCCLTVISCEVGSLHFDAGEETLSRTNLGLLRPGSRVNLERSLQFNGRLGGHFVTGHVDSIGQLDVRRDDADWSFMWFRCPAHLTRQMASKGSVAVDGVSLTLVDVEADRFSVALIPHTLQKTTLGSLQPGDSVNLETDLLAKYVTQQLGFLQSVQSAKREVPS